MGENVDSSGGEGHGSVATVDPEDGDARLRALGYEPRLERGLSTTGNVVLTLSDITPAGSLRSSEGKHMQAW